MSNTNKAMTVDPKTEVVEVLTFASIEKAKESFRLAVVYLLTHEPFFASLLLQMQRDFSTKVPTAGVYVRNNIHLTINPNFFNQFKLSEQVAIIKHECFHVLMNHFSRYKDFDHKLFNVAADVAINQLIKDVPQTFKIQGEDCKSATIENYSQYKLAPKETTEYYYQQLDQKLPKMNVYASGQPLDDHDIWKEGYENKTVVDNVTKNAINKAYKEAVSRSPGSIPSDVERLVQEMNKPKLDWKSILRRFVANSADTFIVDTRKRRNRRFGIYFPGTRVECKLNIVEINDTSGSMSDDQLSEINSELVAMAKNDVSITSIDCDTKIHEIRKFNPLQKPKFLGGGGTDMAEPLLEAQKMNADCVIYFGDGYIPEPPKISIPTLWVINGGNKHFKPPYGKVVYMD